MPKARAAAKTRDRVQPRLKKRGIAGDLRIGISGWRYAGWRGKFYPKDLPQHNELEFAAKTFNSVEINGSFYSLQLPSSYQRWYAATPEDFLFAVKGGRFITHMKKLRGVETALANFFASGLLALKEKLGPILWQLPPSLGFDETRLREFFDLLPRNTRDAAKLAKKHDDKLNARAFAKIDISRPIRHAIEVRHRTFMVPDFFELLREHNIGFVIADTAGKFPYAEDITADLVYIRLHGSEKLYVSGYSDRELDWWANRIRHWSRGEQPADAKLVLENKIDNRPKDVFVYFDNDAKVHAPFDAIKLGERLGIR
ncbi:MAG TPA: DUF72 domain-containing protein [Chthoniobacterales bacterium]|jgi:uncharacterized protein YecE (DUF72 family)|nr:DUF72 domain-containing protein [Chthoniobacterales bacterium]